VITDKDGNKAYNDKHEAVDNPNSYIDAVLTHNKLLNINDPNVQNNTSGSGGETVIKAAEKGNQAIVMKFLVRYINSK